MADQKISQLTELAQADIAIADELPIVDTSATETKRFTWASLRGAIATYIATLTATWTNKTLTSPVINTPTGIVKGDVGLGNVDNTSDAAKPISTATQTALDAKTDKVLSGYTDKATPIDADLVPLSDSAAAFAAKKLSWTNIKATLKTYFDTLYLTLTGGNLTGALNEAKGADIASAATTDIGAATGNYVVVTGTTTITGLGTVQAGTRRIVNFSGILTLTHNATSLILPTGANIITAAGDTATFVSLGSGNWVCTDYNRKSGAALAGASGSPGFKFKSYTTATATSVQVTGLDLDAQKAYKIIVKADQGASATTRLRMTVNNDATTNYWYNRWGYAAGAAIGSTTATAANWELSNANSENHYAELMLFYKETVTDGVHISGQSMGSLGANEALTYSLNFAGTGGFSTNVTTIEFLGGAAGTNWKVWVFELATS